MDLINGFCQCRFDKLTSATTGKKVDIQDHKDITSYRNAMSHLKRILLIDEKREKEQRRFQRGKVSAGDGY